MTIDHDIRPAILITDADNTLWDTNKVFADAQLNLLAGIEEAFFPQKPSTIKGDRLAYIRSIDQALARSDHRGLKYPPLFLVREIVKSLGGTWNEAAEAVGAALVEGYFGDLKKIPALRPGVSDTVADLKARGVQVWVVSEGRREIIEQALVDHGLQSVPDKLIVAAKSPELFERLRKMIPADAFCICAGDQLDRDIVPAKQAGFQTAYFPGGFQPTWTDKDLTRHADVVIEDFRELLPLFSAAIDEMD